MATPRKRTMLLWNKYLFPEHLKQIWKQVAHYQSKAKYFRINYCPRKANAYLNLADKAMKPLLEHLKKHNLWPD